jgi:hypothetical protein
MRDSKTGTAKGDKAGPLGKNGDPYRDRAMKTNPPNRRADDMTAEEVKEFWHGFCERRGIDEATRARGDAKIERDPDYWADQTMMRLLDSVST